MAPKAKADAGAAKAKAKGKAKKEEKEDDTPKMKEPDYAKYDASVKDIQDKIDKLQKEKEALQAKISERSAGKDGFQVERAAIRSELDEVSKQMDEIKEQRDKIKAMLGEKRQENADMKAEMNKMKRNISYTDADQIDKRIAEIDYKMQHESLSLKDEKNFMAEVKELKKMKPKLAQLGGLKDKLANLDAGTDLRAKNAELNEQFSLLYEKKKGISARFGELQEKRTAQEGDLGEVREEKQKKQDAIRELIEKRNALRDAFNEEKRAYKVVMDEQRRIRNERIAEERKKDQEERNKKRLERQVEALDDQPYVDELARIEQCSRWCKSMLPQDEEKREESKKDTVFNNKDGEVVMLSKEDRAHEDEYAINAKTKGKKRQEEGGR